MRENAQKTADKKHLIRAALYKEAGLELDLNLDYLTTINSNYFIPGIIQPFLQDQD